MVILYHQLGIVLLFVKELRVLCIISYINILISSFTLYNTIIINDYVQFTYQAILLSTLCTLDNL